MFSGKSEGAQSLVTFRLTDLHQPTTAVLLGTPVPRWPEETHSSPGKERNENDVSKERLNGETTTPIEPGQVPEATVQEVLKLLDGVDLSFMKRRQAPSAETPVGARSRGPLMEMFEERMPGIFDIRRVVEKKQSQAPLVPGSQGKGVKRSSTRIEDPFGETPKQSKLKINSPVSLEKKTRSAGQAGLKNKPRVSIRSIDSASQTQALLVLSTEETITKAFNEIISQMNIYNALFENGPKVGMDSLLERADIHQVLKDTRSLSSHMLRLYSCQEAFNRLGRDLVFGTVGNLDKVIRHGSKSLLYANQAQDSNDFIRVMAALEAMVLMERLIIRVSEVLVIPEESLGACVEATRFHLHNNILPFYDARIRAAVRPNIENPAYETGEKKTGKTKKTKGKCLPGFLEQVEDRILASLELLADIIPMFKIEAAVFSPFIRTMIQSMTSSCSSELHFKTVNVLSSVYYSCSDLRFTIFNDVFTVVTPFLGIGKKIRKDLLLASEAGSMKPVNVLSALLVQTVQTCADLPTKSSPEDIRACYSICISAADQFWSFCMERIVAAKTLRLETDADFMCVMLGIVQDVLELSSSMYWPCASTILIRLVSLLNSTSGLQSQDALVRQICVDILGKMLTFVHKDSLLLTESIQRLDAISREHGYEAIAEGSVDLILRSLASSEAPSTRSCMRFLCLRTLCEDLAQVESTVDNEDDLREESSKLLIAARDSLKRHESQHCERPLADEDVALIMKVTVHEQFLSAAPAMLSWLIEILDSKHQTPTTRSKAVRALGDVVAVDKRLLEVPSMLAAIEHALQDDSISVREAALVIVGKHMIKDASLATRLLHVVIRATEDAGSSVRKSAIKILRDCALVIPHEHKERSNDAYRAILNRSTDSEESVKAIVVKIFKSLWFDPVAEGEDGLKVERSPADRAVSLANLANSVIETLPGTTSGIRNLMDRSNPLVVLLSEIKNEDRDDQSRTRLKGEDTKTSVALLEQFMHSNDNNTLSYLRAIYALVLSNPRCCIPENDPLKFVRALAPHLKVLPGESQGPDDTRKGAEETLYSLGIVSSLLDEIVEDRMLSMDVATEISEDLPEIINKHKFTTVVSAACGCLAACAMSSPTASGRFLNITAQYITLLENPQPHMKILPRFIFIVGQLYRFGTKLLQQVDVFLPDQPELAGKMTPEACMRLLSSFWAASVDGSPALAAQIQRNSLEAICQVMIASPLLALRGASDAQKAITQALQPPMPPSVKLAALNGLIELVQADAHALYRRQSLDSKLQEDSSRKPTPVAAENGEGDASQSSAILQNHWDDVLALAADTHPNQKIEEQSSNLIRRKILYLVDIAVRDGLVGPWTTVPTLVSFAMDMQQDISVRSLKLLKVLSTKYPQYVDVGRLIKGVKDSYPQYSREVIRRSREPGSKIPECVRLGQARLRRLYNEVIASTKSKRNDFLRLLIRSFRAGIASSKQDGRRPSRGPDDLPAMWPWLSVLIAGIPFKKTDEVCLVVREIDTVMAQKVSSIIAELHEFIESDVPVDHPSVRECASTAKILCYLHRLKTYLLRGYSISAERQAVFANTAKRSSGTFRSGGGDGSLGDAAVQFSAKAASPDSDPYNLMDIFSFHRDADVSQVVPGILHPILQGTSVITPLEGLKALYEELDNANVEGHFAHEYDPMTS